MKSVITREWIIAGRGGARTSLVLAFAAVTITAFVFAIGPDVTGSQVMLPVAAWTATLLASLIWLGGSLRESVHDESVLHTSSLATAFPLWSLMMIQLLIHWVRTGLPLCLTLAFAAWLQGLHAPAAIQLAIHLPVGALGMMACAQLGAAVGLRRSSAFGAVVAGPLPLPLLMVGASQHQGGTTMALIALTWLYVTVAPIATAACLRIQLSYR